MKSFLAITLLATLLGGGYWKYNNPTGSLDSLGTQVKGQALGFSSLLGGSSSAQVTELSNALETSRSEINLTQDQLQQNRNSLDATSARLATTEKRLNELLSIMDEQQKILTEQQAVNLEHASRFADMDSSMNSIRSAMGTLGTGSNNIDDVTQRLAALETQINENSAQPAANAAATEELNALSLRIAEERSDAMVQLSDALRREQQTQIDALKDEIGKVRQTELSAATDALREEQQTIHTSNERSLRQSIAGLQNQFSTLSAVGGDAQSALALTNSLDERIASVENAVASIGQTDIDQTAILQRVESQIDTRIQQVRAELTENSITVSQQEIAQLSEQLDAAQNKILALETQSADTGNGQQEISEKIAAIEATVGESSARLAELDESVQTISSNPRPTLGAAAAENDIQQRLDSLKQGVIQENTSNAEQLRVAIDEQRISINEINEQLLALNKSSHDENAAQLQAQIDALVQRVDQFAGESGDSTQLASKLDQVSQKVAQLEQSEFLTPADLAASEASKDEAIEYTIYFDRDSASISDDALKVLQSFLTQEQSRANSVSIYGFTDSSGNAQYNQRLALRRANQVRSWLIQEGFDFRKINEVDGLGEDVSAAVRTGQTELTNQRAVVLYAFQK